MRLPVMTTTVVLAVLVACSPALDWREFQPEGSGLVASFPCKPDRHARNIDLAVQRVRMELLVCEAGEARFALGYFDVAEPARVSQALIELRRLAAGNLGAKVDAALPAAVPGMTPNDHALRLRLDGRQPDGSVLQEQAVLFTKGLRIYQATVLGRQVSPDAADTFFAALRLPG